MRKTLVVSFLFFISLSVLAQKNNVAEMLIPQPVSVTSGTGNFHLTGKTTIHVQSADKDAQRVGGYI